MNKKGQKGLKPACIPGLTGLAKHVEPDSPGENPGKNRGKKTGNPALNRETIPYPIAGKYPSNDSPSLFISPLKAGTRCDPVPDAGSHQPHHREPKQQSGRPSGMADFRPVQAGKLQRPAFFRSDGIRRGSLVRPLCLFVSESKGQHIAIHRRMQVIRHIAMFIAYPVALVAGQRQGRQRMPGYLPDRLVGDACPCSGSARFPRCFPESVAVHRRSAGSATGCDRNPRPECQ